MAGLYIHIPFCKSRCIYCGFYSSTLLSWQDRYTDAVCREMEMRKGQPVSTVYLGGGTPSQLSEDNLQRLFYNINKVYGIAPDAEVTMECNPDDLSQDYVAMLSRLPVNRISMGVQTFDEARLQFLHRRHTATDVRSAIDRLRTAGIGNISIDLMFGFPGETLREWANDIREAIRLNVEHISAYSLMYEEGTQLNKMLSDGKIQQTDEETERLMYELLIYQLEAADYEHYEISNFAKRKPAACRGAQEPDTNRSRHNSSYWDGTPYLGLGAAAHSYNCRSRQWNVSDVRAYIAAIERGVLPFEREMLDDNTRYNDLITTALRTREGIRLSMLAPRYRDYLLQNAQRALCNNLLRIDDDRIHLTRQGLFVSDDVMSDLIYLET